MTLSAPNPWGDVVAQQASAIVEEIAARWPDLVDVTVAAVGRNLWVSGPAGGDEVDTVWRLVQAVAQLWPGWLAGAAVGAVIAAGATRVVAGPAAMVTVAGRDVGRDVWLASVETVGLP